jgi:membrane-bound serine protease (ClpP class)
MSKIGQTGGFFRKSGIMGKSRKLLFIGILAVACLVFWLQAGVTDGATDSVADGATGGAVESVTEKVRADNSATIINVGSQPGVRQFGFSRENLQSVRGQIDRAVEEGIATVIFCFTSQGGSFESFSDLARDIARLATKKEMRTVAFVPKEATGMSMLAVFACREIVADEFAQLGQVTGPTKTKSLEGQEISSAPVDEQSVVNMITNFARAGGHDPLPAEAMVHKQTILYEIVRGSEKKLVDQAGFEQLVQHSDQPWQMAGSGPLVGADEVLLLSGRKAQEIALVKYLAADEDELARVLDVNLVKLAPKPEKTEQIKTENQVIEGGIEEESEPAMIKEDTFTYKSDKAVFIVCSEMVDEGLYESIKRRTQTALDGGATYIIYEIDTFGGRVDSAIEIWNYFMHEVAKKAHTVAYVRTKAISAGALISVACQDIIMKSNTQIGDCAPIMMGGTLEGVEREKMESPLRSYFEDAAKTNGYPVALCKAMVSIDIEVYQVKNLRTGKNEYFETDDLPRDDYNYDLEAKKRVVSKDQLFTVYADKALEYGLARVVVEGLDEQARSEVLAFLEDRDKVSFSRPPEIMETNWSEELVRWLTSPAVSGILLMVALLGIYAELNSPGLGLPGAVAVAALLILFGSKFLIGMANWWEIAVFVIGMGLLLLELFVIPGFGIAGISGTLLMIFALAAMMVTNRPDEFPLPVSEPDWREFEHNLYGLLGGFAGFLVGAYFITRYLPHIPVANRLILSRPQDSVEVRSGGQAAPAAEPPVVVGDEGISLSSLRPSGLGRFGRERLNVVSQGEMIESKRKIRVVNIVGNSIVVREVNE